MTSDMQHRTYDTWHVTKDTWHIGYCWDYVKMLCLQLTYKYIPWWHEQEKNGDLGRPSVYIRHCLLFNKIPVRIYTVTLLNKYIYETVWDWTQKWWPEHDNFFFICWGQHNFTGYHYFLMHLVRNLQKKGKNVQNQSSCGSALSKKLTDWLSDMCNFLTDLWMLKSSI